MQEVEDNILLLVFLGTTGILVMVIALILIYIRHQQKTLRQLKAMRELESTHQRDLLSATIQSQENERKRIGQDLHDDVGAALSGLKFAIDLYDPPMQHDQSYQKHAHHCKTMIDTIISDVRHISHHLSPALLTFKGLPAALESYFIRFNGSGGPRIRYENQVSEGLLEALPLQTSTAIYRVIEELLNNTVKHANASEVTIILNEKDGALELMYTDNGRGLPSEQPDSTRGIGFFSMESRLSMIHASHEFMTTRPGFGMLIRCPLP